MELPFNTPVARGVLYSIVTLSAIVVFGNAAEICEYNDTCPPRIGAVIGFGVIAFVVAAVVTFGTLCRVMPLLKIEFFLTLFLSVLFLALVGLASSIRTGIGRSFAASFAWVGAVFSIVLLVAAAFAEDGIFDSEGKDADENEDEEAPAVRYAEPGPPVETQGAGDANRTEVAPPAPEAASAVHQQKS